MQNGFAKTKLSNTALIESFLMLLDEEFKKRITCLKEDLTATKTLTGMLKPINYKRSSSEIKVVIEEPDDSIERDFVSEY